jgi:hypothetical protein
MTENQILSFASMVSRSGDHLAANIDDELVLMDVEQGNYYGLNSIGADIWQRLEGEVVVSELCAALSVEYDADIDTISREVLVLLERLAEEGLIEVKS